MRNVLPKDGSFAGRIKKERAVCSGTAITEYLIGEDVFLKYSSTHSSGYHFIYPFSQSSNCDNVDYSDTERSLQSSFPFRVATYQLLFHNRHHRPAINLVLNCAVQRAMSVAVLNIVDVDACFLGSGFILRKIPNRLVN